LFGETFPEVKAGAPIDFFMFGKAIAEFEFTLVVANAPIDRFARGDINAMTGQQKRGALLFFGKARCVHCHTVSASSSAGVANEMFSNFLERDIGVPQLAPVFGVGKGNVIFDGPGENEDFGREEFSGFPADRHLFRTAPRTMTRPRPACPLICAQLVRQHRYWQGSTPYCKPQST